MSTSKNENKNVHNPDNYLLYMGDNVSACSNYL